MSVLAAFLLLMWWCWGVNNQEPGEAWCPWEESDD